MFPLKDDLPTARFPVVTATIILINVLVYLAGFAHAQLQQTEIPVDISKHDVWVYQYGEIPCEILQRCGNQPGKVAVSQHGILDSTPQTAQLIVQEEHPMLTLLTSMFLHGSLFHLLFNMLFFWVFSNNVEDSMGRLRFLLFYLGGGVIANIAQALIAPGSTIPQIGASGAIAATIGAYMRLYPRTHILTVLMVLIIPVPMRLPAWLVAGFWGVGQLAGTTQSLFVPTAAEGGIAYMSHLAGFMFGLLVIGRISYRNPIYDQMYRRNSPTPAANDDYG